MPARPPNSQPPETPTSQVEFTVPPPPEVTPHGVLEHLGNEPTDETRAWVAQVMNSETFLCKIGDFLKDYGPPQIEKDDILDCKNYLVSKNIVKHSDGKYVFSNYTIPPSKRVGTEDKVFKDVAPIIEAIFKYADSVSKRGNSFSVKLVPDNQLRAGIPGTNHKMDACIIEVKDYKGVLENNNIMISEEFKKERTWDNQIDVREQIVGDSHHILNDDPRRMFIYGVTMEDNRMSVWYFSRSHTVKSISFDWIANVDLFIEVYLAFAFATPAQLGVDPLVHKAPVRNRSKDVTEKTQQYIYECPSEGAATRYYRTMHSLTPERPYRISGRMTRIWQVIEVDDKHNAMKMPGVEPVILKDVWLDLTRKTEAENMDLIFEAVDKFVADAHERYPGPDGLRQFMAADPRFEHFDQPTKLRLEHLLTDKRYRSLFLTKRHAWKGEITKKLSKNVKCPLEPIFVPHATAKQNAGRAGEVPRTAFSQNSTTLQPKAALEKSLAERLVPTELADRAFAQKQQSRFVYEEVCSRLWDLPTIGDLMDVLRQALDALQVLWCAGWVHRDISNGNILAFPVVGENGTKFRVKLADLEFAQVLGHPTHSSDPRTGTPYFMPFEVLDREYLFRGLYDPALIEYSFADQLNLPGGGTNPDYQRFSHFNPFALHRFKALPANATVHIPPRDAAVSYNYQHDLESLWWVALYYITAGVGHISSFRYAATIFTNELKLNRERTKAFQKEIQSPLEQVVRPSLQAAFPTLMNTLRLELYTNYVARALFGQLKLPESYSQIHAIFATTFDDLLKSNDGGWQQTKIVSLSEMDNPRKRALEDMPVLEDAPESTKRGRVRK